MRSLPFVDPSNRRPGSNGELIGIKEKILAAKRAGISDIILSIDNKKDIEEIKPHYLTGLKFHYVKEMIEVIQLALMNEKVKNALKF